MFLGFVFLICLVSIHKYGIRCDFNSLVTLLLAWTGLLYMSCSSSASSCSLGVCVCVSCHENALHPKRSFGRAATPSGEVYPVFSIPDIFFSPLWTSLDFTQVTCFEQLLFSSLLFLKTIINAASKEHESTPTPKQCDRHHTSYPTKATVQTTAASPNSPLLRL